MTVNYITEPIPSAMGRGKGGWRGTLDFHWPEDIPAEAIGRDIELSFRLHGGEANRTSVVRQRTVRLYAD